jgi:hypothetical protein
LQAHSECSKERNAACELSRVATANLSLSIRLSMRFTVDSLVRVPRRQADFVNPLSANRKSALGMMLALF